jgi:hypothetical protein
MLNEVEYSSSYFKRLDIASIHKIRGDVSGNVRWVLIGLRCQALKKAFLAHQLPTHPLVGLITKRP